MDAVDGEQIAHQGQDRHPPQDQCPGVRSIREHRSVLQTVHTGVEVEQLPVGVVGLVHGLAVFQREEDTPLLQVWEGVVHHVDHGESVSHGGRRVEGIFEEESLRGRLILVRWSLQESFREERNYRVFW